MTQVFIITAHNHIRKNSLFLRMLFLIFSLKLGFSLMDETYMHPLRMLSCVSLFPGQHNAYF